MVIAVTHPVAMDFPCAWHPLALGSVTTGGSYMGLECWKTRHSSNCLTAVQQTQPNRLEDLCPGARTQGGTDRCVDEFTVKDTDTRRVALGVTDRRRTVDGDRNKKPN